MMYLKLYFAFFKIGILSFGGGYSSLPLIQKYIVETYKWIDMSVMVDLVSISQMTPGPIAINAASFVGNKLAGFYGAIIASIAVITPQIIILSIIVYSGLKKFDRYLVGINFAVIALILTSTIKLIKKTILINLDFISISLFIVVFTIYYKKNNTILLILLGAVVGIIKYLLYI